MNIASYFIQITRRQKQAVILLFDVVIVVLSLWAAFSLRLGEWYVPVQTVIWLFIAAPLVALPIFIHFGLYRAVVRYIGFQALWAVTKAVSLYALLWALLVLLSGTQGEGVPRSVTLINWVITILLIGGSRMIARWWFTGGLTVSGNLDQSARNNVVIYGAGAAGIQLATALSYSKEYRPVGYIDDNPELQKRLINALRVYPFTSLGQLIESRDVGEVLLAIPSASRARRNEIIKTLEPYPVHVRTLPGMAELAGGQVKVEDIKEVDIEDLLGRDPVPPRQELMSANIRDKVVMVTGAGGSIGAELCRQILQQQPRQLVLFEQNEYSLYAIERELESSISGQSELASGNPRQIIPVLGTVLNQDRLVHTCKTLRVQTIYHAAAYKHVPLVEKNPVEAVINNIQGTLITAQAAIDTGAEAFVLISTDKAVRPTNTMGASKRFAELILQGLSSRPNIKTRFTMVRFGNVLGSSGSVIPLFREQIRLGGPVTVTDPKIIRYFMTIKEAAQLVIQAGAMGRGGDVFVLDMGEPVKILDLAHRMIRLSGLEVKDEDHPNGDIAIRFTGLRPGEKLYEELLIGENVSPTDHPLIMRAEEEVLAWEKIQAFLDGFSDAAQQHDQEKIRALFLDAVKGFKPQCGIEDNLYHEEVARKETNIHEFPGAS
jgi:UDP-N-acetylglucosamine 4,6-dehydratase